MNILITGIGGPAGLNTLAFMPNDVNMFGCDCDAEAVERINRTGLKTPVFFKVPRAREEGFIETIKGLVVRNSIDLIIPTVDEELLVFSENDVGTRVAVSPMNTVNICNDKYLLYEKFRDYEFCPVYTLGKSDTAIYGKIFVKPRIGRGSRGSASFFTERNVPKQYLNSSYVVCEFLPGREYTVDAMCDLDGRLVYAVPRIRTEVIRGVSVKGKTEKNQEILKITEEICKVLKFVGPINLQFKLDAKSKPKLVEINPRFSGGLPITAASGINPMGILIDIVEGRSIDGERLEWKEIEAENDIIRRIKL